MSPTSRWQRQGKAWCTEVNGHVHSEIAAIPAQRLEIERPLLGALPSLRAHIGKVVVRKVDRLSCVRFDSARYSVPNAYIGRQVGLQVTNGTVLVVFLGEIIAEHPLVDPGATAVLDDHYGGPMPAPARAVRPKTPTGRPSWPLAQRPRTSSRGRRRGG